LNFSQLVSRFEKVWSEEVAKYWQGEGLSCQSYYEDDQSETNCVYHSHYVLFCFCYSWTGECQY